MNTKTCLIAGGTLATVGTLSTAGYLMIKPENREYLFKRKLGSVTFEWNFNRIEYVLIGTGVSAVSLYAIGSMTYATRTLVRKYFIK